MSNVKISQLPAATQVNDSDVFPVDQGNTTRKVRIDQLPMPSTDWPDITNKPSVFPPDLSGVTPASIGAQPAGNYATLVNGEVPASQLPSYVDDIIEVANFAALPAVGESGKIYVTADNNKVYRWAGTSYVEIVASPQSTDAVPEGVNNLYFTTQRAADAAPVQSVAGRDGDVVLSKTDVGLGNVDNTSDANKPVSTATQTALNAKADSSALSAHTSDTNNPHAVTKSQVGLGNVDNTSDIDKPISTATQTALDKRFHSEPHLEYINPTGTGNPETFSLTNRRYQIVTVNFSNKPSGSVHFVLPTTGNNNGDVVCFRADTTNVMQATVPASIGYLLGGTFVSMGAILGSGSTPYEDRWEWQSTAWRQTSQKIFPSQTLPANDNPTLAQTGFSQLYARADHAHLAPPVVTTSINGLMSASDKVLLDAIPAQLQQRVRYLNPTTTPSEFHLAAADSVWVATSYSAVDYVVLQADTVMVGTRLVFNATNQSIFIKTNGNPPRSSTAIPPLCAAEIAWNGTTTVATTAARLNHANILYTGSTTLPNATNSQTGLMTNVQVNKLDSIPNQPWPTFPNSVVQTTRLPANTAYLGNSTAFGAQMALADRHMILVPILLPRTGLSISHYGFRLGSTALVAAGVVRMGIYTTGSDGLPLNRTNDQSITVDPLINLPGTDVFTGFNFGGSGGGFVTTVTGLHWLAIANLSGNTINIATATPSSAWVMNAVLGSNMILTGSNPEGLTTFILVGDGAVMPTNLSSRQFQHSISTASSTTLRYRVTAPALFASYTLL